MSREIKFRAWSHGIKSDNRAQRNKFGEWVFPPQMLYDERAGDCLVWKSQGQNIEVMQYTGLHDRNGKEGYHKDIWEFHGVHYLVEWDEEDAGFYLKHPNKNATWDDHMDMPDIKGGTIIGNIYEHPHLLGEKGEGQG